MNSLIPIFIAAACLLTAARFFGPWLARVFRLDDTKPTPATTARASSDSSTDHAAHDADFVASPTQVVFAHHFASIAGAGPIVGPILALAFGWGPAWIWIIVGGIFFGAVHDMSSLAISMREGGRSVAEIARRTLGRSGFLLFITFLILVLSLVNAIFLNLSAASLTSLISLDALGIEAEDTMLRTIEVDGVRKAVIGGIATTSVFVMTLCAPFLGWAVMRGRVRGVQAAGIAALICATSVVVGFLFPLQLHENPERAKELWTILLTVYVFAGAWTPVWLILQPRDFCNVQILYVGLALLAIGVVVGGLMGTQAPLETMLPERAAAVAGDADVTKPRDPMWPFLMITIACGAISGFHSLVSSGTTVKQISRQSDCRRIGFNGMLLESFLAVLVLITVASHLSADEYESIVRPVEGKGNAIVAFALACGRSFSSLGIPTDLGSVLGILIIEGFLVTTLDTAVRLCRYLFEELWTGLFGDRTPTFMRSRLFNTAAAVAMMFGFAAASWYDAIWPIFGSGNQLIGALTLTTVTVWLILKGRRWLFAAVPAVIMLATTLVALALQARTNFDGERWVLAWTGSLLFVLAVAFAIVAAVRVRSALREVTPAAT